MDWVWEIPIHRDRVSTGFVASGDKNKALRASGESVESILLMHMERFPRLHQLLASVPGLSAHVTSYRCRVHSHLYGPNWLVVGEAEAMVDPMTSNGVTAALRHSTEAAALIARYRQQGRIPWIRVAMYSRRVQDLARFFNCGIERMIYDWPIRRRIGLRRAGDIYTVPAWTLNFVYARARPRGVISSMFFSLMLSFFRAATALLHTCCRSLQSRPEAAS